jgi:hypothetical protein
MHDYGFELFQTLTKAGAIPGKDFSVSPEDDSLRLSERAYSILKRQYPMIHWDDLSTTVESDPSEAVAALQSQLGTNFVGQILDYITQRLQELSAEQAAWYLTQVLTGVETRTGVALYELLSRRLTLSNRVYIEQLLQAETEAEPCSEWIHDLVLAAGGSAHDVELSSNEALLTERGMRLLATVWSGDFDLYAELARATDSSR